MVAKLGNIALNFKSSGKSVGWLTYIFLGNNHEAG